MSESNAQRPPKTYRAEAEEFRKSLDWFEPAPPVPVEAPAAQAKPTPSAPAAPPQDTAPTDFDG